MRGCHRGFQKLLQGVHKVKKTELWLLSKLLLQMKSLQEYLLDQVVASRRLNRKLQPALTPFCHALMVRIPAMLLVVAGGHGSLGTKAGDAIIAYGLKDD